MRVGRGSCVSVLILAGLVSQPACAKDWSGLLKNNPFGDPPPAEKPPEPTPQFELRGVVKEKSGYLLSLYETTSKKSWWMEVGQTEGGLIARDYDPKKEVALLERQGKSLALNLKSTAFRSVAMVARATSGPGNTPGRGVVAAAVAQVAASPLSTSEAQRLSEISEQIRQRREQRQRQSG
jgi:hypothetical protein